MDRIKYYIGVGSRETPEYILKEMESLAFLLAEKGYVLLSGGAKGADTAFENGCDNANGMKLIFRTDHWYGRHGKTFNNIRYNKEHRDEAMEIAKNNHPVWERLPSYARKLMMRNSFIAYGGGLKTEADFLICWTPDGATTKTSPKTGGTGQSLRLAKLRDITVYNMANMYSVKEHLEKYHFNSTN